MRLTLLLSMALAALSACGSVAGKSQCTKGATDCVGNQIARTCGDDGNWVVEACAADQQCMAGSCAAKTDLACQPTDSTCMDSTHAIVCNDNGVGFKAVTCPSGTTCQGEGLCVGTCVMGSSECNGANIVLTCTDGNTVQQSACTPGTTSCVSTSVNTSRVDTAACMPLTCDPNAGTVCGNKASDPNSVDPGYSSECVSSPTGTHWESTQCAEAGSCSPGNGCSPTCTPGAQRCSNDGTSTLTCGTNGTWGAPTACTPSNGAQQYCQFPSGSATPVCGDPVCAAYPGACEADGFHPCVNGHVSATAAPCETGVCTAGSVYGGYTGGECQSECNPGESKCDGNEAIQTCTNNHTWSVTATACPANNIDKCVQYQDPASNGLRAICGQCAPGTHRCTNASGTPGGTPATDIETCDNTGHYGAFQACAAGQCQANGPSDAFCAAQCIPGATVCIGSAPASPPNPYHPGTDHWGQCDANGNLPTAGTACASGTSCRKSVNGQPVGTGAAACVVCVGGNIVGGNEVGLVDTLCTSSTTLERCAATNTWAAAATCSTVSPYSGQCVQEQPYPYCYTNVYPYCSQSYIQAHISPSYTCGIWFGGGSVAQSYGGVSDCCSGSYCDRVQGAGNPTPSTCN